MYKRCTFFREYLIENLDLIYIRWLIQKLDNDNEFNLRGNKTIIVCLYYFTFSTTSVCTVDNGIEDKTCVCCCFESFPGYESYWSRPIWTCLFRKRRSPCSGWRCTLRSSTACLDLTTHKTLSLDLCQPVAAALCISLRQIYTKLETYALIKGRSANIY